MNEKITIERLIEDLDNLYGNDCFNYNREQSDKLANDIRNLIKQNKEKQDKLDKIEKLCDIAIKNCYTYVSLNHSGVLMNAHEVKKIIKGEDK